MYIRPGSSVWISFLVHIPFYLTMITSSNGMFFRVTGPLCGEFTGHRWITLTKASDAEFDVFFDMCLNKQLSKQSGRRWFETPLRSLWHRCSVYVIYTAAFAITLRPYVQYKKKTIRITTTTVGVISIIICAVQRLRVIPSFVLGYTYRCT